MINLENVDGIIALHDFIVEKYGGVKGLRDVGTLIAALERPFLGLSDGSELFQTDLEKACALFEDLINFHPFTDGNKRTATVLLEQFLDLKGYQFKTKEGLVEAALKISRHEWGITELHFWLQTVVSKK